MIIQVALPTPLHRLFDYRLADSLAAKIQPGCRVRVPFGKRQLIGLVVACDVESEFEPARLKQVLEVLDHSAVLDAELLQLARWAAHYYFYPEGEALMQALPSLLRKGEPAHFVHETLWRATPITGTLKLAANAARQQALLDLLLRNPEGVSRDLIKLEGISSATLRTFASKGWVESFTHHPRPRHADDVQAGDLLREAPMTLNTEQALALQHFLAPSGFHIHLLEGVTGSGKTEVYLQAIQHCLEAGQQVLILVPEIGLTPQTVARFKARFNVPVLALHSGLSDRQRLDAWLQARDASARILIGTRSAIFTPLARPGLIILDEEHDASFKQQDGFRYSARDLALVRARNLQIPVLLGSATPSLESLHNVALGRFQLSRLQQRAGGAEAPRFHLLDLRGQSLRAGISDPLLKRIAEHLEAGTQVLVFLNRRGFAPSLICHQCGAVSECTRCDARMTLHRSPPHLHCHHCDRQTPIPRTCHQCGSEDLRPNGAGTERTEDFLSQQFPKTEILRIDRDSTARKGAMDKLMHRIHQGEPCILVGTQMLAKGHHFPKVTLVAILDADSGLFSADFRGMEKTSQLILQVAGRAGRAQDPGEVVLQTHHPDHPMLHALIHQGYNAFARDELKLRAAAGLPPYSHHALLRAEASQSGWAEAFLRDLRHNLEDSLQRPSGCHWSGPFPAPMEKRAGLYRAQLLIQGQERRALHQLLALLLQMLEQHPGRSRVRWSIDVDPLDAY